MMSATNMPSNLESAFADYDEAIRLHPQGGWAYIGRGQMQYTIRGDARASKADLEFAAAHGTRTEQSEAHFYLGKLSARLADWKSGVEHFEQSAALRPDFAAYLNAARILAMSPDPGIRDGARAYALVQKALGLTAADSETNETLAAAYACAGQFDEAIRAQKLAIELHGKDSGSPDSSYGRRLREELSTLQKHELLIDGPETWWTNNKGVIELKTVP